MPEILHPQDAIVRVTRARICGSDRHLYRGLVPDTRVGSTFGHEFVGIIKEMGPDVTKVKVGDQCWCRSTSPAAGACLASKRCTVMPRIEPGGHGRGGHFTGTRTPAAATRRPS